MCYGKKKTKNLKIIDKHQLLWNNGVAWRFDMPIINVDLSPDVYNDIGRATKMTKLSQNKFVEMALKSYIAEMIEDAQDYEEAVEAWNEYVAGGKRGYTMEEINKKYGIK